MTVTDPGSYVELGDGRPAVRFERIYDHPVQRVWALLTDPAELAHWFPSPEVALDLVVGGTIRFSGDPNMPDLVSTGEVLAVEEPHRLAFSWGGDELHFDLEPLGAERTRLTLTNVLETGNTAARNAAGWDVCLAALDAHVAGRPSGGPHDGTVSWRQRYDAYVTAGLPSGAPIPGEA